MHNATLNNRTTSPHQLFPSFPFGAWASAVPVCIMAAIAAAAVFAHESGVGTQLATTVAIVIPVFFCCAAWLATRPSFLVEYDHATDRLRLKQKWPIQRDIANLTASSITTIDVRRANTDDARAYATVAVLRDGTEIALTAEVVSKSKATTLAADMKAALSV